MNIRMLPLVKLTSAAALFSASTGALASGVGTVTHVPFQTNIPTLGGAGLIVLAALLGIIALRFMKDRETSGSQFLVLALAVGAVASGGSGLKLINEANAISGVQFSDANGGVIVIPFEGFNSIYNDAGFPQKITDISVIPGCTLEDPAKGGNGGNGGGSFRGTCNDDPGTVLEPSDTCEILVVCPILLNGGNGGVSM